jgi:hypothetical protein
MRYIPTTYTTTNDVELVHRDFIEFYNLAKSNHVVESHSIEFYFHLTYFLKSWSNHKRWKVGGPDQTLLSC